MVLAVDDFHEIYEQNDNITYRGDMDGKSYIFVPSDIVMNQSKLYNARYVHNLGGMLLDMGFRAGPDIYKTKFDNLEGYFIRMELIPFEPSEEDLEVPEDGVCH